MRLLAELRRRNVIRMAGLYLVGAWLITQVSSTVLPMFDAPAWLPRTVVILLAIGFVPTLVFSWVFELTPQGLKRDAEVKPEESIAPQTARRMDRLIIAMLILALVYFSFDKFVLAPRREAVMLADAQQPVSPQARAKSIAVLPFTDLSPGHDQEYFSDGMAEEILNALAQVKDLKVAGRTSSFFYKGKNEDLRAIGKALCVANVLEGSVRKQREQVRITAQLIQASDGTHLWSQAYDGDLADVFELQERIARAITDQLKVVLQGEQKTRLVPVATTSPEAYALYLQATAIFDRRDGPHYQDAIAALQEAIRLDPKYARAHSRLAALYVVLLNFMDQNLQDTQSLLMQHARSASALDPALAEPWASIGFSLGKFPGKLVEQRKAFDRALELDADDVTTNFWYGLSLVKTGYRRRGTALIDRALEIDPMLPNALRWRGILYFDGGDPERAEQLLKRARDLGLPFADRNLADIVNAHGDPATATKLFASGSNQFFPGLSRESLDMIAAGIYGDAAARARALATIDTYLAQPHEHIPGMMPVELFKLGVPARALSAIHTQLTGDTTDFLVLLWSPQGRALRTLAEFSAFLRDFGFIDLWEQYGVPDGCQRKGPGDYVCD